MVRSLREQLPTMDHIVSTLAEPPIREVPGTSATSVMMKGIKAHVANILKAYLTIQSTAVCT